MLPKHHMWEKGEWMGSIVSEMALKLLNVSEKETETQWV